LGSTRQNCTLTCVSWNNRIFVLRSTQNT